MAEQTENMKRWMVRSGKLRRVVVAATQWEAWDSVSGEATHRFGLVASAEPDASGDPFVIQTETLMRRWGRARDALEFHDAAVSVGLIQL